MGSGSNIDMFGVLERGRGDLETSTFTFPIETTPTTPLRRTQGQGPSNENLADPAET